ncbi:hypothetical protein BGE01nite_37380 [Brevifollis gellanilyticus]|uniref:FAD-binding domain-containing protein n=1 Tax=Brevifollis gellanilyticus TaxID=748831 RepID=A0A512MCJ4_9BACT|nr:hypothetical protein BGE01nite_37380 [Brevifollis gellanilyticus]
MPLPAGKLRIGFQVANSTELSAYRDPAKLGNEIRKRFPGFPRTDLTIHEGHYYKLARQLAHKFVTPGAAVVGDAAHTVHPTGGQGMNMGFVDAEHLAAALEKARADPAAAERHLAAYHYERRKQVLSIQRRTHLLGVIGEWAPNWITITTMALSAFNKAGPMKRRFGELFMNVE